MNILIFNWRDIKNPDAGGAEVFTHENARRWIDKGHSVTWFTSSFPDCKNQEIADGVKIIRDGGKYTVYLKAREYYKKYFSNQSFDIVIDEINTVPFFTPEFVNSGEKIVVLIHQLAREFWFYETKFPINYAGRYFFENRWLKKYKDIPTITVSDSTKNDLMTLGFNNISVVPEGINFKPLDSIPEKEKEPTLIFVGRLKKAKRPDHAIEAFNIIKKKLPGAKLWVIGDGYFRKELDKMSCSGVEFFGAIPQEKKLNLMSRAHAILVPGVREGWGLVVTEANAMGTPAIGYNVPGLRDSIRDGKTGLLCEPNPEAMAQRAFELLQDNKLQERLSRAALAWAGGFGWDNSANITLKVLEGVYE
jgi:glycosyltransferase involved in cell wall biosynthesis